MKKMLSLLLVLSLVVLTACANTENPDTTTEQITDTTQTTETTTASEQTTETSRQTEETTTERKYIFETEICETTPMKTEIPELQEKIERNRKISPHVANKVVIHIGSQKDIPHLRFGNSGYYFDETNQQAWEMMGGGSDGYPRTSLEELRSWDIPVYQAKSGDRFAVYVNDALQYPSGIVVFDYTEDETRPEFLTFNDFTLMCEELGSGTHYAYINVKCKGDRILVNGEYDRTEYMEFRAYFILEID